MAHGSSEHLDEEEQAHLRRLVAERGVAGVARLLGLSRGVVASAAGGIGVRRGSVALVRAALAAQRSRSEGPAAAERPSAPPPGEAEYEAREARAFQVQLREAESNTSRRVDAAEFARDMAADPALIAERIGWILNGSYGYGAMQAAKRAVANKRMNRAAWLVQAVAALEWRCPQRSAIAAWKKLTAAQKKALDSAVKRAIRDAEKSE